MAQVYDFPTPAQLDARFASKASTVHTHDMSDISGLDAALTAYDARISGIEGSYGEGQISRPAVNVNSDDQRYIWTTTHASQSASTGTLPEQFAYVANLPGSSDGQGMQIACTYGSTEAFYFRRRSDSASAPNGANVYQPWRLIYHSGNFDPYSLSGEVSISRDDDSSVLHHVKLDRGGGYPAYLSTLGDGAGNVDRTGFYSVGGWDFYIDDSGNSHVRGNSIVGGVPLDWQADWKVVQLGDNCAVMASKSGTGLHIIDNAYYDASGLWRRASETEADSTSVRLSGGQLTYRKATTGAADGLVVWVDVFSVGTDGTFDLRGNGLEGVGDLSLAGTMTMYGGASGAILEVQKHDGSSFDHVIEYLNTDANNDLFVGRDSTNTYLRAGGVNALQATATAVRILNDFEVAGDAAIEGDANVAGSLTVTGYIRSLSQVTVTGSAAIAATVAHTVIERAASAAVVMTLPAGSVGARHTITEADGFGLVSIVGTGGEKIRGLDTFPMNPWASTTVEWHATSGQWLVV